MKIKGIDFVQFYVENMQDALAFYRDVLGLPLFRNFENKWVEFEIGSVTLVLCGPEFAYPDPPGPSVARIALAVEDINAAVSELRDEGISVDDPGETDECYMAAFRDPFDNRLILHQRKDGTWG